MMLLKFLLFSTLARLGSSTDRGSVYTVGHLTCKGEPYENQPVRIYNKNYVYADTLWMDTMTDEHGNFSMKVYVWDYFPSNIIPYVYIPNFCGSVLSTGRRCSSGAMQINVPPEKIDNSHLPKLKFDLGNIELHNNDYSERLGLGSILWGTFANTVECRDY